MNEHPLPISAYPEEEWQAAIRYAEEHAGEFESKPAVAPARASNMARSILDMANTMNRAYAAQLRKEQP